MNQPSRPVSDILRSKDVVVEGEEPKKQTREEWRKAKELDEERKAGTAPAAVDEEGRYVLRLIKLSDGYNLKPYS